MTHRNNSLRFFFTAAAQLLLMTLAIIWSVAEVRAQDGSVTDGTTPSGLTPGAPAGSYVLSGFDNVNFYNGAMNVHLPLRHVAGRGEAGYTMMLAVEQHWRMERFSGFNVPMYNWWYGLKPGYGPGVLQGRAIAETCTGTFGELRQTLTRFTWTAPEGTEYELHDVLNQGKPRWFACYNQSNMPNRGTVFVSADGEAATFVSDSTIYDSSGTTLVYPSGYLMLRDGTRYRIDEGLVSWMRDRNGNKMSFTYDGDRITSITDSLNRQVTVAYDVDDGYPYGVCDRIAFKGFGGATRYLRISKTSMSNALRSGYSIQTYKQLFPEIFADMPQSFNPTVISTVWLPDNRNYQLQYNSYGELARVVLPTGGAYEYDHTNGLTDGPASGIIFTGFGTYELIEEIYRRAIQRRTYPDGTSGSGYELKTTYSRPESTTSQSAYVEVDQRNQAGALQARTRHYYFGSAYASFFPTGNFYNTWKEGREYKTEALSNDGATVLRRSEDTWEEGGHYSWCYSEYSCGGDYEPNYDPRITQTMTTLVDTNQVSKETYSYDQYNNRTDVYEYDHGSGSAGSLVRRTHTDYLTTNPVNSTDYRGTSIHIRSLPSQVSVYDSGSDEIARATFEYDNYTSDGGNHAGLIPRSGISGLDSGYSTGYTTRGNATATTHYILMNGSGSVTAYAQYDQAGNVVKTIDPRSCATTLDFSDRFGAPEGEARSNSSSVELNAAGQMSYAFPTSVTNCLGHTAFTQFDYYLGRPVDAEDINGMVSSGYYNDSLDRPTQVIHAANQGTSVKSQTTLSYDDLGKNITSTSDQNTYGDNALKSQGFYDGLGRTTESRQYEGGTNYITVQTQYDALGRAHRTSNPFRPWQGESAIWTTTGFDALSRVTSVTTPDSAVVTTSYSGNAVTVSDQNSKSRKSITDALGRLTSVYEDPTGLNYQTSYSYDVLDDLTTVTQGTQTRTFVYNSLKRLTSASNPESGTISYQYDNNGNLMQRTDARGVVTTFGTYDALNRPTTKSYSDGTPSVTYSYDSTTIANGKGRVASISSSVSTYSYSGYDALGRPLGGSETIGAQTYPISYSYDLAGHVKTMVYPSGHSVSYNYDNAGRLGDQDTQHLAFTGNLGDGTTRTYSAGDSYSAFGGLTQEQFGTATPLYHKRHYNNRGQLYDVRVSTLSLQANEWNWDRGAVVNYYSSNYSWGGNSSGSGPDNNGNLTRQQHWIPTDEALSSYAYTQDTFTYDSLNRLSSISELHGTQSSQSGTDYVQAYSYDRLGNRTINTLATWGTGINNSAFEIDPAGNNQLLAPGDSSLPLAARRMQYDQAGNLKFDSYTGAGTRTYDAENRMTGAQASSPANYAYDGDGRRTKRIVNGTETWQVYGLGSELIAEYAANAVPSAPQKEYGYRNGESLVTATVTSGWGAPPTLNDNPLQVGVTTVQSRHITELRAAIDALRAHFNLAAYSWQTAVAPGDWIKADPILEMRTALDQALGAPSGGYSSGLAQGQLVKAIHLQELRDRVLAAWQSGSGGIDIRWLVTDQLGTPRMVFDQTGSLANASRHDYLPFGEELFAGTSGRTTAQGYSASDGVRQHFTQKERDNETGLDYFGARYYGSSQGRFTTPDPLLGSGNPSRPQTWNRYTYVVNNPLRMIDPDGLDGEDTEEQRKKAAQTQRTIYVFVGGKDRGTPWQPDKKSAKAGYKPTTVPGDNFADLAKNAPKGTEVKVINEGDAQFSPQGFKDALADKSAAGVIFVGDTVGTTDADGVYQATGLDFGNNGSLSMGSPVQVNAENVAIFGCDSSNLKSMFSFTGTNQSLIGMNSGSEGYSSPGWLGRAAYATAGTFERGGNPDQAVLAANNRFHNFGATAPFGPKNVSRGINVHNAEPKDVGDSVLKLR